MNIIGDIRRIESERRRICESTEQFVPPELGAGSRGTVPQTVGEACRKASTPMKKGLILRYLARDKNALELGTGFGFGAAYIASTAKNLDTVDYEHRLSKDTDLYMGVRWGMKFDHAMTEFLRLGKRFEFAHIDGDHTNHATVRYYLNALRLMPNGGVMVFDDIHWSTGMKLAWKQISNGKRHLEIFGMGVLYVGKYRPGCPDLE